MMIDKRTVFVLGAGASAPYGFPIGKKLVDDILQELDRNWQHLDQEAWPDCRHLLGRCGFNQHGVDRFRDALRGSRAPSIDRFLERQEEDSRRLGKVLISMALTSYQKESPGLYPIGPDAGDWIAYLLDALPMEALAEDTIVSVVTFNYDTSFEHILGRAMADLHGPGQAVPEVKTVHVHGKLGRFGRTRSTPGLVSLDDYEAILVGAEGITIVSDLDDTELPQEFAEARGLIEQAEVVCFLGFGYLRENLRRLGYDREATVAGTIHYCCTFGMGAREISQAKNDLGRQMSRESLRMGTPNQDALAFLRDCSALGT